MITENVKLGKLEVNLRELVEFLVEAKKACYAGGGEEIVFEDGSKSLTFQKGIFHYTDNYAGFYQASGTETVRWLMGDGQRIWQMAYFGGMLPQFLGNQRLAKETFAFLKKALSLVSVEFPFRGSEEMLGKVDSFSEKCDSAIGKGSFGYRAKTRGDITSFIGREEICFHNLDISGDIFRQNYMGGLVIPR